MSNYDEQEQLRLAQAQAEMNEAAVIDAGTKDTGKDAFMDDYQTIAQKIGPDQMRGFNAEALATSENIGELYHRYASDLPRAEHLTRLPYKRAVADMVKVANGVFTPTSHQPAWAAKAQSGFLSREEFHSALGDRLTEKQWQAHHEKYDLKPQRR